ncbi:MAG: carboxypeptidase-like regulatory domain-containing protein [Candidatus Sulfotelmatobacter sp.]
MGLVKWMFVFAYFLTPLFMAADGSVYGTVRDPTFSVVANVPIVITSANTGKKIQTRTGRAGDFGPISLPIGEYKVQITALCYKPYSKVIEIADGQVLYLDIRVNVLRTKECQTELESKRRHCIA